jgi:hypothetical protein
MVNLSTGGAAPGRSTQRTRRRHADQTGGPERAPRYRRRVFPLTAGSSTSGIVRRQLHREKEAIPAAGHGGDKARGSPPNLPATPELADCSVETMVEVDEGVLRPKAAASSCEIPRRAGQAEGQHLERLVLNPDLQPSAELTNLRSTSKLESKTAWLLPHLHPEPALVAADLLHPGRVQRISVC